MTEDDPYGTIIIGSGDTVHVVDIPVVDVLNFRPHGWWWQGEYHRFKRSMPMTPTEIASIAHEANRRYQLLIGEPVAPPWDEASMHQQSSVIDGVVNAIENDVTPEQSHQNWLDFKKQEGWILGPEKDEVARTHPLLKPYAELDAADRAKDELFLAIVGALRDVPNPVVGYDAADTGL